MKHAAVLLVLSAAVCIGVTVSDASDASASCLAPAITLSPSRGVPGSAVVVSGRFFFSTCNDTSVNGAPLVPNAPDQGVAIAFVQDGRRTQLRTVDAGSDGSFSVTVVVPVTAHGGLAQFETSRLDATSQPFSVLGRSTSLAFTGRGTTRLTFAGLSVLASGLALLTLGRRTARPR